MVFSSLLPVPLERLVFVSTAALTIYPPGVLCSFISPLVLQALLNLLKLFPAGTEIVRSGFRRGCEFSLLRDVVIQMFTCDIHRIFDRGNSSRVHVEVRERGRKRDRGCTRVLQRDGRGRLSNEEVGKKARIIRHAAPLIIAECEYKRVELSLSLSRYFYFERCPKRQFPSRARARGRFV